MFGRKTTLKLKPKCILIREVLFCMYICVTEYDVCIYVVSM